MWNSTSRNAWKVTEFLKPSADGSNLLNAHHLELASPPVIDKVRRSGFMDARWTF
jgi:hypothetical protein